MRDVNRNTPLALACINRHVAIADVLVKTGGNLDTTNKQLLCAYFDAVKSSDVPILAIYQ